MKEEEKSQKSEVVLKEEKILDFWNKNEIFKKSLEKDAPNGNFVFYDGPPFATGLPHYGHILPGTIKDLIPRYQTMKGKHVLRRWGWDCHGLPIENLIEKELGLSSKKDIETLGIEKFNLAARNAVLRYADEWKKIIPRSGRWVEMENSYLTMDPTYTESVWWSFKTLHDKGFVSQDFKSMLLCPHCETTLSNFEVNLGYKDITDISVYVEFELLDEPKTHVLAWTTTPWTLPGNAALAINPEIEYVAVEGEVRHKTYVLAKSKVEAVFKQNYKILRTVGINELLGKKYKPLFDYYNNNKLENRDNAWKIYAGSFVTDVDGTGVVHIAPAFGEDDMNLGKAENLPFIQHVNPDGTFKTEVTDFAGQKVKPIEDHQKTDVEIIKYLAKKGTLFAKEKIVHSYPHCWRCGTPLLNYATTSWFVKVTAFKDRLVELNKTVSWTPEEIGEGRFGKWLEGARDWAISRSRYWGAPLPVWENEKREQIVLGSIAELKELTKKSGNSYFAVRHGEAENNVLNIVSNEPDFPHHLTEKGIEQAHLIAEKLKSKKIDALYSSPFVRTKETAEIIAKGIGFPEDKIKYDERIQEFDFGDFDKKPFHDFLEYEKSSMKTFDAKTPHGESYQDAKNRIGDFLYSIDSEHQNKNILIVSHGMLLEVMPAILEGANAVKSKYLVDTLDPKVGEFHQYSFVPLPHNENYELDLHRPYIDEVTLEKEGRVLKRVPEVFDTWYDSGSMPFASQHYPFENKEEFEKENSPLFPADFIAEGLDQTRGWFYTLLVLSTGLFDTTPYKHVLVNGLVLAEDGRKMSKSLNNYPDLMEVINKYGADALRYYLISSPLVKAEDFNFKESGVDEVSKKLIQKVYNTLSFYELYPALGGGTPKETVLDTWILSRLNELIKTITESLDKYELDKASRPIMDFVGDLSTWYIRRSRDRFKSDDPEVKYSASYYTGFVLREFSKAVAPFMPFLAEEVYRKAEGELESVHLEDWPVARTIDAEIIETMKKVREVVTKALEIRQKSGHKVRQPLASLAMPADFGIELNSIIADEVNVKEVKIEGEKIELDTALTDDLKNEGFARDIIRAIQDARKKELLNPNQKIKLVIFADDKTKSIIASFEEMIKLPTQVERIEYSEDNQKYVVEGQEVSISIVSP